MDIEKSKIKKSASRKLRFIFLLVNLFFLIFLFRLFQFQFYDAELISKLADERLTRKIKINALRGEIRDKNGNMLAFSRFTYDIEFHKFDISTKSSKDHYEKILKKLSINSNKYSVDEIREMIESRKEKVVKIFSDIAKEKAEVFTSISPRYIAMIERQKRIYPNDTLASNLLGVISETQEKKNQGIKGLEFRYEKILAGEDGFIQTRTDALGRRNRFSDVVEKKVKDGSTLKLTLDIGLQFISEDLIKEYQKKLKAKKIYILIQDSKTAEILSMASSNSFDANFPRNIIDEKQKKLFENSKSAAEQTKILYEMWSNPFCDELYEPGSTFKSFTTMVALEENLVNEETSFNCHGRKFVDNTEIRCHLFPASHGLINLMQAYSGSCNVAFMDMAEMIGKDKFYKYLNSFKLLSKIDIGIEKAISPVYMPKEKLVNVDLARLSFGHAISLSPLHLLNFYFPISSGGEFIEPRIVKSIGNHEISKKTYGKIISESTAEAMREMMKKVADDYPMFFGRSGYEIGAKTGTSVKLIDGKYDDDKVITSVFAIAPIKDPRINVLVIVDEPDSELSSLESAGVIGRELISRSLNYLRVEPAEKKSENFLRCPDFVGLKTKEAEKLAEENKIKIKYKTKNKNLEVIKQKPLAGSLIREGQIIELKLKGDDDED